MKLKLARYLPLLMGLVSCSGLSAQVYSPKVLEKGQPDSTDLTKFAEGIYAQAHARTPRQKAEAIWRFFLTDGRFVKPGFWYHIAGWTYEEPNGEVLDPVKLLNSYGFGLCYHIAPLLQAVFLAGGFKDARCWFLTGHTVTEVFYDGAYHYFDSDMMGYNVAGGGPFAGKAVASVQDIERDPDIFMGKLQAPDKVKMGVVDYPWYPADVRAKAIGDLANLFTTANDNYLYTGIRYSPSHSMDFELRPGEKLIRFFQPEEPGLYYLPYKFDGQKWTEFPQEISEYKIRTQDGPRSQKDDRGWATGRIEYTPPQSLDQAVTVIRMPSPYVIIDARFKMTVELASKQDHVRVETSTDGGGTWQPAGEVAGPRKGEWATEPEVIVKSEHGRLTAVSGTYGYAVRITKSAGAKLQPRSLQLVSRIQLNPRSLPAVHSGENKFVYSSGAAMERIEIPAPLGRASLKGMALASEQGQEMLHPSDGSGEATYMLEADGRPLAGFDVGARFLDLASGLAPNKLTAETRSTRVAAQKGDASILWATTPDGPFQTLWSYDANPTWPDGMPVNRLLRWSEGSGKVRDLPAGTKCVYVKLRTSGPAVDSVKLAAYSDREPAAGMLNIRQVWTEGGVRHEHTERMAGSTAGREFAVRAGNGVQNESLTVSAE